MELQRWSVLMMLPVLGLGVRPPALAQQPAHQVKVTKAAGAQFTAFPNIPPCATGVVEHGDPSTGPSVFLFRFAPGCTVPWHWHTPNEHLMMVSGSLELHMKGQPAPVMLRAGDYVMAPSRHAHQPRAVGAASFFLHSDGPFDIHYVDDAGNEIPPEQALKGSAKPPTRATPAPKRP
jgi:quercetin dioxygenase-like cupin family protein